MLAALYELPLLLMFAAVTLAAAAAAWAAHLFMRTGAGRRLAGRASGMAPLMQSVIATFAALSVAFLSNAVWQTENEAREAVETEARNIRLVLTYSKQVSGAERDAIAAAAEAYAEAVAQVEWPVMTQVGAAPQAEAGLAELYRAAIAVNPAMPQRGALLSALDRLSAARDARLALARDVVMPTQWSVVIVLALTLIAAVAIGHGNDRQARAMALGLVALAIGASLFGIAAHDRPFTGQLAITPAPILRAAGG